MTWDFTTPGEGTDATQPSQKPPAAWSGRATVQSVRQTLSACTPDGSRRYELTYECEAGAQDRVSITGCDRNGELVTELRGEALLADAPVIAQLLLHAADTAAGHRQPAAPGRGAPVPFPRAPRAGELWDREETERLANAYREGADPAQIAHRLGRSEKSVRWKLYGLRLVPCPEDLVPAPGTTASVGPESEKAYTVEEVRRQYPSAYKRWTSEEDDALKARCAEGASLAELAEEFGRNEGAIASRLLKLGAEGPAAEEAQEYGGQ
ncbi:hypothetical protein ABTY61_40280 [Kitasatospora sp. NPDC096128]|uniref:hypothetical protein n=1 Tax=Kitasatospora sp. NPDC096128 TaxID=3155547 RepID=UPI00332CF4A5